MEKINIIIIIMMIIIIIIIGLKSMPIRGICIPRRIRTARQESITEMELVGTGGEGGKCATNISG